EEAQRQESEQPGPSRRNLLIALVAERPETPKRGPPSASWWFFTGVLVAALAVLLYQLTASPGEPALATAAPSAPTPQPFLTPEDRRMKAAREQFAELYVSYLLKTYYVRHRGFCPALFKKLCLSLAQSGLLESELSCGALPNDAFVLAIGRYQHNTGLPVDGKAGPETVRLMLGGSFSGRQGMAAAFCPGLSL
ncbi:MAG: peptidoglycan-binding domain-containing protein, partial [Myxococcota bacterium]